MAGGATATPCSGGPARQHGGRNRRRPVDGDQGNDRIDGAAGKMGSTGGMSTEHGLWNVNGQTTPLRHRRRQRFSPSAAPAKRPDQFRRRQQQTCTATSATTHRRRPAIDTLVANNDGKRPFSTATTATTGARDRVQAGRSSPGTVGEHLALCWSPSLPRCRPAGLSPRHRSRISRR